MLCISDVIRNHYMTSAEAWDGRNAPSEVSTVLGVVPFSETTDVFTIYCITAIKTTITMSDFKGENCLMILINNLIKNKFMYK